MSINYAELEQIVIELKDFIIGSSIKKITQYKYNLITIEFRKQNKELTILFHIDPKNTFIGLCDFWDHAPKNPYHFTSVSRKHLNGLVVKDFYSEKNDRILHIKFEEYEIIAELLGKNGNIFLIDLENKILATLYNRNGEKRIERTGTLYKPLGTKTQKEFTIRDQFIINSQFSILQQITNFYLKQLAIEKTDLEKKRLENELKKKNQFLDKLIIEFESIDEKIYKETADLIIENINDFDIIKNKLKLEINKNKTLSENAQYFYELYKKQLRKKRQLNDYIESIKIKTNELKKEIEDIIILLKKIENNEIEPKRILKSEDTKYNKDVTKFANENSPLYSILKLENGKRVVYGKSAIGNNELLKKYGKGNFWWFHVRDFQGPFVILLDENLTNDDIKEVSTIAIHFSKGRNAGKAAVIYTKCKYVKTIPKIIGKVIYSKEKEIIAIDDMNIIKKIAEINES